MVAFRETAPARNRLRLIETVEPEPRVQAAIVPVCRAASGTTVRHPNSRKPY